LGLFALGSGRSRAATPAWCAAVVVLVVADPELAGEAGFALSVLATGGILLVAPGWRDVLRARGVPPGVAEALVIPAAEVRGGLAGRLAGDSRGVQLAASRPASCEPPAAG
jgi:competence protein ComEC